MRDHPKARFAHVPILRHFGLLDDAVLFELVICVLEGTDRLLRFLSSVRVSRPATALRTAFVGYILQIRLVRL